MEAEQLINDGIQQFQVLKDQQLIAYSRLIKTRKMFRDGQYLAAIEFLQKFCLPDFSKIGDIWGIAFSHHHLGENYLLTGSLGLAKSHLTEALSLFQNSNDKLGEANSSIWLSKLCVAEGDYAAAKVYIDQGLQLAAAMGVNDLLMAAYFEKALDAHRLKALETAITYLAVANYYAQELGAYEQQKFQTQIQPQLKPLQQSFGHIKSSTLATRLAAQWKGIKNQLAKSLEKEELAQHIQKLLEIRPVSDPDSSAESIHTSTIELPSEVEEDPFVRQVRRIIEAQLQNTNFTLKDLCREVGMSHSQLHRRLSAASGQSVSKFIRNIRLDKARELLLDPQLTIAAVAYDSGFKDPDYFYRVFKQAFDMTPNEFRKAVHKEQS